MPEVVIIGAGIAGMTAAYRLQQQGLFAQVFEARNRIGGRIFSAQINDAVVELGGKNFLDGGKAEHLLLLANELKVELKQNRVTLDDYYFNGDEFLSTSTLYKPTENLKLQLAQIAQKSETMQDVIKTFCNEDTDLYKVLSVKMEAYEAGPIESLSPIYVNTLYHMLMGGLSAAHQEKYMDVTSVAAGNVFLLEKMAKTLKYPVRLNMPLIALYKTGDKYVLRFENGENVTADILILTNPCSTYENIDFAENVIPNERLQSIRNVQYGSNGKILVPLMSSPITRTVLANDHVRCFFESNQPVLTLYYVGDSGKFTENNIEKTYLQERPMLEKAFGKICPPFLLPKLAVDSSFASYQGPICHSFANDSYAKGSYSYIAKGQELILTDTHIESGEVVKTLFAPYQNLYFAGEHTSILMDVTATMESACESGERVARMIVNSINRYV